MLKQISLFEADEEILEITRRERIYNAWLNMPDEQILKDGTSIRKAMFSQYHYGTDLWSANSRIHHECPQMPKYVYIWFQSCESPEYWVKTRKGNPESSEHVEVCPFCNADLKNGSGDAIVYKSQQEPFTRQASI